MNFEIPFAKCQPSWSGLSLLCKKYICRDTIGTSFNTLSSLNKYDIKQKTRLKQDQNIRMVFDIIEMCFFHVWIKASCKNL